MAKTCTSLAALAAIAGVAAVTAAAQEAPRTVRDGVYSAEQAARGERVFASVCMNCHEVAEFAAAGAYLDDVDGRPLWETFEYVSADMPEDDPGALDPEEYAAVIAYLLSVYGVPGGEAELPVDRRSLESITITRPALPGS